MWLHWRRVEDPINAYVAREVNAAHPHADQIRDAESNAYTALHRSEQARTQLVEALNSEPSLRTLPHGLDGEHQRWAVDRVARQEAATREAKARWQRQQETRRTEPSHLHWSTPDRGQGIGR